MKGIDDLPRCQYEEAGRQCDRPAYFEVRLDDAPAPAVWNRLVCTQHTIAAVYVATWISDQAGEDTLPWIRPLADTGEVMVERMGPNYDPCFPARLVAT